MTAAEQPADLRTTAVVAEETGFAAPRESSRDVDIKPARRRA